MTQLLLLVILIHFNDYWLNTPGPGTGPSESQLIDQSP